MDKKIIIKILRLLPTIGIALFVLLYANSSTMYPGGSQYNVTSIGFDWEHNYWCDLMNRISLNSKPNPAYKQARIAHLILCGSILYFFVQISNKMLTSTNWNYTVKVSGIISMILALFIFTPYHNELILLSGIIGVLQKITIAFILLWVATLNVKLNIRSVLK